jgi:hypothetical protein
MRALADVSRIRAFLAELGRGLKLDARMYLTGGSTAVLEGWRASTVDIDVSFEPEADEIFRAIARLKDEMDVNVELAAPSQFIPELPGWRDRSPFVLQAGRLAVHHYDAYSQALSKIERGHATDLADVEAMISRGMVEPPRLQELFAAIEPELHRHPAIDPAHFRAAVERVTRA